MSKIHFKTKLFKIDSWTVLLLPKDASEKLPSRGMTMVSGTINSFRFKTVLEPDGRASHWFRVDKNLQESSHSKAGETVELVIEPTKEWVEPDIPEDMKKALNSSQKAKALYEDITPAARWDWLRWVRAVKTTQTREKHLDVMLDKLNRGMRRPCCFNRSLCSEPYVSKNWVLLTPTVN